MSYTLTYITAAGTQYVLNDETNSFLVVDGMRGFGILGMNVAAERRPYWDGVIRVGGPYTPSRIIEVAIEIMHSSLADWASFNRTLSRAVQPYLDPDNLGTLWVETPDALTRYIDCWMVEWPDPEMFGPVDGIVIPKFWAPDPFFYDPSQHSSTFALDTGAGVLYEIDYPVVYETGDIYTTRVLTNQGDVDTWPVITIIGAGQNPRIENATTGKVLELSGGAAGVSLSDGDYIVIDMGEATATFYDVYVTGLGITYHTTIGVHYDAEYGVSYGAGASDYGHNIIHKLSDDSEFWPLVPGNNTILVQMQGAYTGYLTMTWYSRYLSGL